MLKSLYLCSLIASTSLMAEEAARILPSGKAEKDLIEQRLWASISNPWLDMPELLEDAKMKSISIDSKLLFALWCNCDDVALRQWLWLEGAHQHRDWAVRIIARCSDEQRRSRAQDFEGAGDIKTHEDETYRRSSDAFSDMISAIAANCHQASSSTPALQKEIQILKEQIAIHVTRREDAQLLQDLLIKLNNYNGIQRHDLELWWLISTNGVARELLLAYYRMFYARDWDFEALFENRARLLFAPREALRRIEELKRINEAISKLEGPQLFVTFSDADAYSVYSGSIRASSFSEWKQMAGLEAEQLVSVVVQLEKAFSEENYKLLRAEAKKAKIYVQRVLGSTSGLPGYYDIEQNPFLKTDKEE